jgi:hypothetical protein
MWPMRRVLVPGALLLLCAGVYLLFFRPKPAHISTLVPEDFAFGVFTRSLNDLRQLYEGPYSNKEADPAHLRFGQPCNVPGLDGVNYEAPAASFWTSGGAEIFLMPVRDARAFEQAFERERESIRVLEPERVAKNYFSLSEQRVSAKPGARNELVLDAERYPLALCGRPRDGNMLRMMLSYVLLRESPRKPPGVRLLIQDAAQLPAPVADAIAAQCEDLLLGFPLPASPDAPVRIEGEATLVPTGFIARSAHLSAELDLTDVVASFPHNTVLLLGLVLDAPGWQQAGVIVPLGDAAFACGIVEERVHARRFTVLFAARPRSAHDLERLRANGHARLIGPVDPEWTSLEDEKTEVRTAPLPAPPKWLEGVLRSEAESPPPVYVSAAVERGIWYCAIGSQAEGVVRRALGCLRDMRELGLSRVQQVASHREFLAGPHVGLALVTPNGLKALGASMPFFEIASLAHPPAITAVLDVDERAKLDVRIAR